MKLIVGCGYLGSRVARLWQARGVTVAVVTRSADRARQFQQAGYLPVVADVTDAASLDRVRRLSDVDTVLYAVGYDRAAGKARREVYVEGLGRVLDALPSSVQRFIYISTTGVYGQTDGSWIDEESSCDPASEVGRMFLEAESVLRGHSIAARAIILRMAGLYGPGRIPRREELIAGKPLAADPDAYLNLIYVDDAARVVLAVENQVEPPRMYLVSDGHPVVRREYYAEAARLLGAPSPVFAHKQDRGPSDARGNTDKRVNNARLINEIGYQLQYSTYKQGLAASTGSS
ncbi:MAG: SDR family oxidoreductase [Pirellulales bacterium]